MFMSRDGGTWSPSIIFYRNYNVLIVLFIVHVINDLMSAAIEYAPLCSLSFSKYFANSSYVLSFFATSQDEYRNMPPIWTFISLCSPIWTFISLCPGAAGEHPGGAWPNSGISVAEADIQARRQHLHQAGWLHHWILSRLQVLHHHQTEEPALPARDFRQGLSDLVVVGKIVFFSHKN